MGPAPGAEAPRVLALFGPTAVGKTDVAIAVADRLRERGETPVAVSCDALQVYRGLEILTGAPSAEEQRRLEHRLVGIAGVEEEFAAGRFAALAHAEIDALRARKRRPIVVGGTGLYLRAALSELDLRPPVDPAVRRAVERDLERHGAAKLWEELPESDRRGVHPNDAKRIARLTELRRAGLVPHAEADGMWAARPRVPTLLVGLVMEPAALAERIERRVEAMADAGAGAQAAAAAAGGASRTARAALGFRELAAGDIEATITAHRAYARRQLTWMRRLEDVVVIDRTARSPAQVAAEITDLLDGVDTDAGR